MAPRRTCHKQAVPVRGGYDRGVRTMQAPARAAHRRSLSVSDRLQERLPVPVLGLELAARQHQGPTHVFRARGAPAPRSPWPTPLHGPGTPPPTPPPPPPPPLLPLHPTSLPLLCPH